MIKKLQIIPALLTIASLFGCETTSYAQQAITADHGPYPATAVERTPVFVKARLKDPYTAQMSAVRGPKKAWVRLGGTHYGYATCVQVNAKNALGAFTGPAEHMILWQGERVKFHMIAGKTKTETNIVNGVCSTVR